MDTNNVLIVRYGLRSRPESISQTILIAGVPLDTQSHNAAFIILAFQPSYVRRSISELSVGISVRIVSETRNDIPVGRRSVKRRGVSRIARYSHHFGIPTVKRVSKFRVRILGGVFTVKRRNGAVRYVRIGLDRSTVFVRPNYRVGFDGSRKVRGYRDVFRYRFRIDRPARKRISILRRTLRRSRRDSGLAYRKRRAVYGYRGVFRNSR